MSIATGAIVVVIALIIGALAPIVTKKDDSPVEQAAEAVLRDKGIDIDFSPDGGGDDDDDDE